ncbi:MAG: sugar ABC transporter permease [Clostridia bacterium]|nr:sugar ABC transporter permease [Clostridia bacterium]
MNKNTWQLYSLAAIPILLVFVFSYLPMFGIIIAFKNYKYNLGIMGSKWVGFDNFKFFTHSTDFIRLVRNTLGMNALFIIFGTMAAVLVAVFLYDLKSRNATKVYQTILITPHFMSWVIVAYIVYAFLNPQYGLINSIIQSFGVSPKDWYAEPKYWPGILTVCYIWKHVGMDCVVYYAALMGMDNSLIEAAKIDGANKKDIILHIIIPTLLPLITILTILKIGNIFRADFGLFYQVPRNIGKLYATTDVVDTYVFRAMRVIGDMGMSSAVGFLQSIVGMILVVATNKASKLIDPETGLF